MNDPLCNLSIIKHCIANQAIPVIIPLLNDYVSVLSPHIKDCITLLEDSKHTPPITLSLIHFTLQNYKKAIYYFIEHNKRNTDDENNKNLYSTEYYNFFVKSIHIKMIELYPINNTTNETNKEHNNANDNLNNNVNALDEEIKKYIFTISNNDPLLLTFVIKHDITLLQTLIQNFSISIHKLKEIAESENLLHHFYKIMLEYEAKGDDVMVKIDAYMYYRRKNEIFDIIKNLLNDLQTCYSICFYISECYNLYFTHKDIILFLEGVDEVYKDNLYYILSGDLKRELNLKLMAKNNKTDFGYLQTMIKPLTRSASAHTGIVFSNAVMNMSTTNDTFHRINIDLLCQTRHWNKCIGYSCLGMIHMGNEKPLEILQNVLPNEKEMSDGGSLISLGMIECNKKNNDNLIQNYLLNFIESANTLNSQTLMYGGCLGLGLVNIGKYDKELIEIFLNIIEDEDVLAGEASVYAIGMNIIQESIENNNDDDSDKDAAHNNSYINILVNNLYNIGCTTKHEKISRACGIAISLAQIQKQKITPLVDEMLHSKNEIIRSCAAYCIGSSFVGTSDLKAISILSSLTNDVCDDVKRSCVISLGLVCCNNKETLFSVLEPFANHHCQFVRGAVAITLGFFSSGSSNVGNSDEHTVKTDTSSGSNFDIKCGDLLEVLMYDSDSLVRQSALIGVGFFLAQKNKKTLPNFKRIVERLNLLIVEKQENNCNNIGAIIGRSLMEGGGRNIVYGVTNLYNKIDTMKVTGYILFMQYWYSYSHFVFLGLCSTSTFYACVSVKDCVLLEDDKYNKVLTGIKEDYDVNEIRVPELKSRRRRRLRRRYGRKEEVVKEEEEKVVNEEDVEKEYFIKSGERMTYEEMKKCGLKNLAYKFVD